MRLLARPLTAEAFAPYGEVLTPPKDPGRAYFESALANSRANARPSVSLSHRVPLERPVLESDLLERHEFSSQTFVPLDVSRWLVVVCPHAPGGGPDAAKAIAFVAGPGQGVTYRADTWHHGLTVLDRAARFAIFMWRDGGPTDEEFVRVPPFTVTVDE
ncbi:MAG: ureidoglycolate lyase [Alphaproteobacteria bacterium]|nr:ureidoglycolate lyase [Alphaproteobacteria bacterium]MCW5743167.1 ureidoglycolate lyase [Alphaproteobacteria bacterium]